MTKLAALLFPAILSTSPLAAQTVFTIGFDDVAIGASSFQVEAGGFGNLVSGGTVVGGTVSNPARSGDRLYGGTALSVVVEDQIDYSWPGIGAYVTGSNPITLSGYDFDPDSMTEILVATALVGGGASGSFLSIGSTDDPLFLTRVTFSSDTYFTLDDLTFGVEGIAPGIPEPATWAMLAGGFGLIGLAGRRRRAADHSLAATSSK